MGGRIKAICKASHCTHEAVVAPLELIQKGYGDIALTVIERRMVCVSCGTTRPTVQYVMY